MKKVKGFTLVELIVVMVILAILASLLIPSLVKYIDKSRKMQTIADAREVYTAAQTALTECYGRDSYFRTKPSYYKFNVNGKVEERGCVTNNGLGRAQASLFNGADIGDLDTVAVAARVLYYLESDKSEATSKYVFKTTTAPTTGITVDNYLKNNKNSPGVIICYDNHGKVDFIQYGNDGYLVTIQAGSIYVKENGTFIKYDGGNKNRVQNYFTFEDDDD